MVNFNEANSRCLILVLNLILLMTAHGNDLTNGNFGAGLPTTPRPSKSRKETTGSSKSYPFSGTLESIDPRGKFITLKGKAKDRQILLNSKTRYFKADRPATLDDAIAGDHVSGSVRKIEGGQEEALSLHIGEKTTSNSRKKLPTE